jgi:SWI/SNF-related matrix-associated actin-dependent regulator 1 of chromatin subfamily A
MELKIKNGVYYVLSDFSEKDAVKAAGFWWHGGACRPGCKACAADIDLKVWFTPYQDKAARLAEYADQEATAILKKTTDSIESSKAVDADIVIPAPDGLAYMPFQRAGIAYAIQRKSTLIADEMGLGKTIQALGFINANPDIKTVLCIVPASLRLNWWHEAQKWLIRPMLYYIVMDAGHIPDYANFIIVNYDMLKGAVLESLLTRQFDLLIVDECHKLKNKKAQRTQKVLGGKDTQKVYHPGVIENCGRRLFLTGTPILNRPVEIFPLVSAIAPTDFDNFFVFAKRFCNAQKNRWGWDFNGASNLGELQTKLRASCMIRRLKKDVLTELPAKRRQVVELESDGYEDIIGRERHGMENQAAQLEELQADVELARVADNEDQYKAAVDKLRSATMVAFSEIARLRHDTAVAKIPRVIEHIEDLFEAETEKLILFAHHHDVVDAIYNHFKDISVVLTGETKLEDRDAAVTRFQTDPACKLFIGSITAAGVGLTLTAASHVVFAELDWVPANMSQAEDRAHRIGQTESVLIQHLVFDESIDAEMAKKLIAKQEIIDRALDKIVKFENIILPTKSESYTPPVDPKEYEFTYELKQKIHAAIRIISSYCDGAHSLDGAGFSKVDVRIGKSLALAPGLSPKQTWLAKKIVWKYRKQLDIIAIHEIFGEVKI